MDAPGRERWAALEPLLDQALDLPPERRSEFLESACGDPALRQELERLLHAAEAPADLLTEPVYVLADRWRQRALSIDRPLERDDDRDSEMAEQAGEMHGVRFDAGTKALVDLRQEEVLNVDDHSAATFG